MSRGHGKVQQAILDGLTAQLQSPLEIARAAGYDITKRSVHQSFRRATHSLRDWGLVEEQWVWTSDAGGHAVICVRTPGLPDVHTTEAGRRDMAEASQRCTKFYASLRPDRVREAEQAVIMEMLQTGRWAVVDGLTGKPVDWKGWLAAQD